MIFRFGNRRRRPVRRAGPITILLIGIVCFPVGACVTLHGWSNYKGAKESMQWPNTTGTILHSKVDEKRTVKTDSEGRRRNVIKYKANIRYSYVIEGSRLQSSQIYMGSQEVSNSYKKVYQYTQKYPVGKTVRVYYSPTDTSNAVLEPGVKTIHYAVLGLGAVFLLLGLLMILFTVFKLLVLTTAAGFVLGSLFGGKKKASRKAASFRKTRSSKKPVFSYAKTSSADQEEDINLDGEMSQLNKVADSSLQVYDKPWEHNWIIKIAGKQYGPFSFEKVISYFERGKVTKDYQCYPASGGKVVKIKDIISRRAA